MAANSRHDQFINLRRRMTDMGYTESFGIDAVDVVEHLLADVLNANQAYRQVQEKESRLINDLSLAQAQLFPLRKENARLARENHELHLDHIKQNEESRREMDRYAQKARELGDQITELRLMNKLYEQQVKEKDEIVEKLREAYEEISDPALKTKYIIGSHIKTSGKVNRDQLIVAAQNNAVVMNMWRAVQQTTVDNNAALVSTLQAQTNAANQKIQELETEMSQLKSSLAAREQELSRTSKLIGNAAAKSSNIADSVAMTFGIDSSATEASNKRVIDQLNAQVDFLNGELAFREAQLATIQAQLSQFDSVRSELAIKTTTMEKLKEENNRLTSRVQFLENKVVSLRSMAHTAAHTPKSVNFFADAAAALTPISEEKESRFGGGFGSGDEYDELSTPRTPPPGGRSGSGNAARLHELEAVVQRLTQEKTQLQQELAQAQEKELAAANQNSGSGRRITASVRGSAASSSSSTAMGKTTNNNSLMVELNKEVEDLRKPVSAAVAAELEAENAQLQRTLHDKTQQVTEALHERDRYRAMIDVAREELQRAQRESKELQEKNLVLQEECETLHGKYADQSQRLRKLEVDARHAARETKELQEQLVRHEEESVSLASQIHQVQHQQARERTVQAVAGTKEQAAAMQTSLLHQDVLTLQATNETLTRQIQTLQAENRLLQGRLFERDQAMVDAHETRDQDNATVQLWKQQLLEMRSQQQQTTDALVTAQMENARLESKLTMTQRQWDEAKSQQRQEQEVAQALRQEKEVLAQRNADLINLVKRLEAQQQVTGQRMRTLEDVHQRYEDQVQQAEEQLQSLRRSLTEKDTAVQKYRHLLEEAEITHEQQQTMCHQLEETLQVSESARHALDIEKTDLLDNFRAVVKDKRRLEEDLKILSARQSEEVSVVQQLRQERDELVSQIHVFHALEDRWTQERQAQVQQLDVINEKLVQYQRRVDSLEGDNRRLMQEQHGWQQNNALLNERNAVIMKRASAANEANKVLTSRLSTVEKERDALRALIEVERQRALDMTKVAEAARIEAATKDIQLQRLRTELDESHQQHST
eukprot:gene9398-6729_t